MCVKRHSLDKVCDVGRREGGGGGKKGAERRGGAACGVNVAVGWLRRSGVAAPPSASSCADTFGDRAEERCQLLAPAADGCVALLASTATIVVEELVDLVDLA